MPILGGVRLAVTGDSLEVTGTDLDLTITGIRPDQPGLTFAEPEFKPEIMPGIAEQRLPD